jgi:hypothetical protein
MTINKKNVRHKQVYKSVFKKFKHIRFGDIINEINKYSNSDYDQDRNLDKDNAIYISFLGSGVSYSDLSKFKSKQFNRVSDQIVLNTSLDNYFQVILNKTKVNVDYVCNYLNSSEGVSILKEKRDEELLSIISLQEMTIPLPPIKIQNQIAEVALKLGSILEEVEILENNIYKNPIVSKEDLNKLDLVVSAIGELSASDRLKTFINQEESVSLEFKTSLRVPYPNFPEAEINERNQKFFRIRNDIFNSKDQVYKFFEEKCLKTIVAFLNSKGGVLIIGLTDDKVPVGIEREGFENSDKYLLHLNQIINNRIGKLYDIDTEIISYEQKSICLVNVKPFNPKSGQTPAHLDKKIVYKRSGPRSDSIEGEELAMFIIDRTKNK